MLAAMPTFLLTHEMHLKCWIANLTKVYAIQNAQLCIDRHDCVGKCITQRKIPDYSHAHAT